MSRRYFATTFTVTILSEGTPCDNMSLETALEQAYCGDLVANEPTTEVKELTAEQVANALFEAGSEPGFFQLDENGIHEDDQEEETYNYSVMILKNNEWSCAYSTDSLEECEAIYKQFCETNEYDEVNLDDNINNNVLKTWIKEE